MPTRRCHYVLSTHWDREWYMNFQDFRYRLVQLLDRILEGFEDGRLAGPFQTDGHAIMLEDYLEIRPERREEVEQHVREGRIVVGPWYVLPDEFLVSGESLVRNLRLGREVARAYGGQPSDAGFACDMFGHNSQMPQIFQGVGVQGAFVWRGSNQIEKRHLIWVAPDGTEMPTYRFGHVGYCSFASAVRHSFDADYPFDADTARRDLEAFIHFEAEHTEVDPILLFDGGDHQEWDQEVYPIVRERMASPDEISEVVHGTLDSYLGEMLAQSDRITPRWVGEMREPALLPTTQDNQWLIPGVLSSRVWIKIDNACCETLLCQWAEPMSAYAHATLGREVPQGFLDVAWRWLLKNHPHDSICGCSLDTVHEDMKFRFSQARGIAQRLTVEATRKLAASVANDVDEDAVRLTVFNPLPRPVNDTAEITLQIPNNWPTFNEFFGFEPKPAFRIYDAHGGEVAYQRLGQTMNQPKTRISDWRFPQSYRTHDIRVSLPLSLPAMGYTTLTVRSGQPGEVTRHPAVPGMVNSERSMENEALCVTIEPNGTLTLKDKRNGACYSRLLTFEDSADIGDGWYYGVAVNDQTFVSTGTHSDVALVHDGPMLTTFRVRTTMAAPRDFQFDSMTRAGQLTPLVIDSLVSLRPGATRVEVETTIHNVADDHRVRVLLPSGALAQTYLADSQFDVVERPIPLRADNHLYRELEMETKPQQSWTAVYDNHRGLAVIAPGLLESAVRDLPERPIALTLLRGTRRTVGTAGEPNGQLRGPLTFRYWIVPLEGAPDRGQLFDLAHRLGAGLTDVQLTAKDIARHRISASLPSEASFVQVSAPAVVTSTRMVDEALEVRLFNPLEEAIEITLTLGTGLAKCSGCGEQGVTPGIRTFVAAQRVDLESQPLDDPVPLKDDDLRLVVGPKKIITLRLT